MRPLRRGIKSPVRHTGTSEGDSPLLQRVLSTSSSTGTPPKPEPSETGNQLPHDHFHHYHHHIHVAPHSPIDSKKEHKGGWKSKLKTLFKKKDGSSRKDKHSNNRKLRKKDSEEVPILKNTPTATTTASMTQTVTPLESQSSRRNREHTAPTTKTTTTAAKGTSATPGLPAASNYTESPTADGAGALSDEVTTGTKQSATRTHHHRLGAEPLELDEKVASLYSPSALHRTPTPQTEDSTKKTSMQSSVETTTDNTIVDPAPSSSRQTKLYTGAFSCGPSLFQAAAAFLQYPDPEMPVLDESDSSSTSAEANVKQHETSEQRRQRIFNQDIQEAETLQEEQGTELIFFQEDEDDWSAFPWSQRQQHTEKLDKDIFLSFAAMGFDDRPAAGSGTGAGTSVAPSSAAGPSSFTAAPSTPATPKATTTPPPATTTPSTAAAAPYAEQVAKVRSLDDPTPPKSPSRRRNPFAFNRAATAPHGEFTTERVSGPIPFARSSPMPSPNRSVFNDTISSDQVVDRTTADRAAALHRAEKAAEQQQQQQPPNMVDRVSSVLKSVPNVFSKLTQTGPSSEAQQIMLTRSSSQVTWVSHADDFAALDARPLTEIVIPTSPESEDRPRIVANPSIKTIRDAIFDSIENEDLIHRDGGDGEEEHKEGEDGDLDAPLHPSSSSQHKQFQNSSSSSQQQPYPTQPQQPSKSQSVPELPQLQAGPQPQNSKSGTPALLLSPSSLTMDSRFVPPLSTVPVRQPSDGEDAPDGENNPNEEPQTQQIQEDPARTTSAPALLPPVDDDELSDLDNDLFLDEDDDTPPPDLTFQPQPETPGERRSLMPPRSSTLSYSTMEDDESVGLNALASPDRNKMVNTFYRRPSLDSKNRKRRSATPPRKRNDNDFGLDQMMFSSSWDWSGEESGAPRGRRGRKSGYEANTEVSTDVPGLTQSDDDDDDHSDSSSENIDHLLLDKRQYMQPPPHAPKSYDHDMDHSSILESPIPERTFSGFDLESVVETDIDEGTGLFNCACWELPPLIEETTRAATGGGFFGRHRKDPESVAGTLLEERLRSDDEYDQKRGAGGRKKSNNNNNNGVGRNLITLVRSTSNSFKSIWSRNRQGRF